MASFLSQWSCSSHILTSRNHPRIHYHPCTHLRSRGHVCIRVQSIPSKVAEINLEKLQTTSTKSFAISLTPPTCITYMGVLNTPIEGNLGRSFSVETINGGEANIAVVAAEAIALAKEALKVAKDAAQFDINSSIAKSYDTDPDNLPSSSDSEDGVLLKGGCLPQVDKIDYKPKFQIDERRQENHEVNDITEDYEEKNILVRSKRQTERRERRLKAVERAATSHVFVRAGPSRKKHSTLQNVDFSDPLCYLRATTTSTKLLTSNEELELSEGIQSLLKLEKLRDELEERYGNEPTFGQWAAAAGLDQKTLRKHLNHGILCKDRMIKSNIRLVISIAKTYQGAGMNLQDLVQEGCRGLVKGAEKFDASKGFKFSTYAHWWIKQAVRKSLSDQSRTIRLPFHMVDATYRVREARKQLYNENGRHPDDEEVAEATGLSLKKLMAVLLVPKAPRSLDQKIGINQNLKPSEVIANPDAETPEDLLIKQFMKQDIAKALANLNPRERQVIRWRFGMEDGRIKTLQECGELMGVCRERIRQIESSAFRKLKNKKRSKSLRQYLAS